MIVVSNTSPVSNLAVVGQLGLLQKLYDQVVIPQFVQSEIIAGKIAIPNWIQVKRVATTPTVISLQFQLDRGEAEAIALALELNADLLLIDERKGRVAASQLGIRVVGILGLLVEAKQRDFVSAIKPIVDDLIRQAGFWVRNDLYNRVLQSVNE